MTAEPIVLIPGLISSPRFYAAQIPALWQFGPVTVAQHTGAPSMTAIAQAILATAPPAFALAGHSMGGYIALEILRLAPARVTRLALLDTSALADAPEQTARRRALMALAEAGRFAEIPDLQFPLLVHADRAGDATLRADVRAMAEDCGADAFLRQQQAIIGRVDSRPSLPAIRCPAVVIVGDADQITPPARAQEIADGIAGAALVTIAGSGHMSAMERPAEVTAALCAWMMAT